MKRNLVFVLAALLVVGAASVASAAGISLEVGATGYDFNSLGSTQKASGAVTNSANLSPDPYINGSYLLQLDDSTKLKLGLMAEDIIGTISPSFVQIGRVEPYADLSSGALSARVSFPMFFLGFDNTNDPKQAEIKYMLDKYYKGIYLGWDAANTSTTFLFTNYLSVAYKLTLDKTTAFVFSASTELTYSPTVWLNDVKPQVTFVYGPLQLDLKESIYFADQETTASTPSNSFSSALYNLRVFTDPKLTFNFASLGVTGLKAYFAASLFTYNNYPNGGTPGSAFYGGSSGSAMALGSSITPGVSYAFGPFYAELAFKYSNYDDSVSNPAAKDPTFDPSLKLSYTFSF